MRKSPIIFAIIWSLTLSIIFYKFWWGYSLILVFINKNDSTSFNQGTIAVFILAICLVQALVQIDTIQSEAKEKANTGCPVDKPRDCGTFCCALNYMCCALLVNGQVYEMCMEIGSPCPPEYCMCSLF